MTDPAISALAAAGATLELARWAARDFAIYDRDRVLTIASRVAEVAADNALRLAEATVEETGFGVVEHKEIKNLASSTGLLDRYRDEDFVSPRVTPDNVVEIPRPAGVVLALTPSTNPVSTLYAKVLAAVLTRNVIVICPHPAAEQVSIDSAELLAHAAEEAGAPPGVIQIVHGPKVDVVTALMSDRRVNVIVATGGGAMVHAAYSSGRPAIGVGPGNAPVVVTRNADVASAAELLIESKVFDNSLLCTNESVLLFDEAIGDTLKSRMRAHGAEILTESDTSRLRGFLFGSKGALNREAIGQPASVIAQKAGLEAGHDARLLVAPVEEIVAEELLVHEKLSPVLAAKGFRGSREGVAAAKAVLRIVGAGHSAAIYSSDEREILRYAAELPSLRLAVNGGNTTVSTGIGSALPLTMTIGTGFMGGSSLDGNFEPKHLLNWTRVAAPMSAPLDGRKFAGLNPWTAPAAPPAPVASPNSTTIGVADEFPQTYLTDQDIRAELRRLLLEEFSQMRSEVR